MKAKRITFWVAVFMLVSLLMVNVASAGWFKCTINRVGATSSGYIVYLTHNAASPVFTDRWFVLESTIGKELLSIALTAYANGKVLFINVPTTTAGSTIAGAYMMD